MSQLLQHHRLHTRPVELFVCRIVSDGLLGVTAMAYIAMANGSPCVVPSVERISPLPGIITLTGDWYVLLMICAIGGQSIPIL